MRCSFCPARRASFTNRSGRATSRFSSAIAPTPRSLSSPSSSVEWRSARSSSGATANDCIVLLYGMQSSRQRSACSDCCFIRRSAPSRQLRTTQYSRHSSPHPAPSLLSNGCSPPVSFSPSRFCWALRFLSSAPASCGDGNSVQVLCCHGSTRPTHLALRSACCWQDSTSSAVSIFQARLLSPPLSTLPPQPSRSLSPVGALAVATLPLYIASFSWISTLIGVFPKTSAGYVGFTIARYAICLAVMLPATFCAGMTLPLITRILYRDGREAAIGEVYAANTAGSIVGVQLAGLVLLPVLGLKLLLIAGAALDVAIGLMLMYVALPRRTASRTPTLATIVIASILVFFAASSVRFDRSLLSSGVYRFGGLPAPGEFTNTFYKDGRAATVTVEREPDGNLILSTNGKPDASVSGDWLAPPARRLTRQSLSDDVSTQVLLPLIAMAHAPHARAAAVIGQGSGMTSHTLLGSPTVREHATIEIEPEMIRASTQFRPVNYRVFSDRRARFVVDDARSYFAGAGRRFDLIVSEPSNPWVSGVAGLFTTEFYARIKRYLAPGGVFAQWMHLYEMNDSLVLTMLAGLQEDFSSYEVFHTV